MPKEYGVKLGTKISVQNNERIGNNIDPRKSKKFRITTFLCLPLKKKKKTFFMRQSIGGNGGKKKVVSTYKE